jgi:O-antigen/teichoic acid export membrane protein
MTDLADTTPAAAGPDRGEGPLRRRVARGSLVNAAFLVGVNGITVVRGLGLAALLSAAEYGVWGIVANGLLLVLVLRQRGIADRFVQQDAADQRLAFQQALTIEVVLAGLLLVLSLLVFPGLALAYGEDDLLLPGLLVALAIPGMALQAPLAIFYRRLDFVRQRRIQAVDPVFGTLVALGLALAGLGYWAAVIGMVAGAWATALLALAWSPYPLAWRWSAAIAREYWAFNWPMMASGALGVVMGQAFLLTGEAQLGLAGAGFITLSATVSRYADRVDQVVTSTLYPALCAVQGRTDVLLESFLKSNRLAALWGFPFGFGLALFAEPFCVDVLGEEWRPAVVLLQAAGIMAAVHQLAFNWDAFYRARGETRPIVWASAASAVAFVALPLPLMIAFELDGLAAGLLAMEAVGFVVRLHYVRRLFPKAPIARHLLRSTAPTVPAVAAILAGRALLDGDLDLVRGLAEIAIYATLVIAASATLERALVREVIGYVRAAPAR